MIIRLKPIVITLPLLLYSGMAVYPFIFVKSRDLKNDASLMAHEKIHLKQQIETLILPFFVAYLFNYLINLLIYKNHHRAYREVIFEREAYANEHNTTYLSHRPFFAFLKYIR